MYPSYVFFCYSRTDPAERTLIPAPAAPSEGVSGSNYFMAFIGTLILLLLILISLVAIVLYRNCQRRKFSKTDGTADTGQTTPGEKSPVSKLNGALSPFKQKPKYALATENEDLKKSKPPSDEVCIEMDEVDQEQKQLLPEDSSPTISVNGDVNNATVENKSQTDDNNTDEKQGLVVNT